MTASPTHTDKSLADKLQGPRAPGAEAISKLPSEQMLNSREQQALLAKLPEWRISGQSQEPQEDRRIQRTFHFDNYADALQFTANIGALTDQYKHYPTIITAFKKVTVFWHSSVWRTGESRPEEPHTGKSTGLQEKDFILAAKTDALITQV